MTLEIKSSQSPDAVLERLGNGEREAGIGRLDDFMGRAPYEGGEHTIWGKYTIWPTDLECCGDGSKNKGLRRLNKLFRENG